MRYYMSLKLTSFDEINHIQECLLKNQIRRTYNNSTFIREKFNNYDVNPDDIKNMANLSELPFTTKDELHNKKIHELIAVPENEISEIVSTSGTTGNLFHMPLTRNDLDLLAQSEFESFNAIGITSHDRCQITITMDHLFMAGLAYYLGAQKTGAAVFRCGPGKLESQANTAIDLKSTVLVGVPSFILKILKTDRIPALNKLILVGESVINSDCSSNELANKIKSLTDADIFSSHGITEMCGSYFECPAHKGLHGNYKNIITEIIDNNGNPVQDGEIGELVVTTLQVEALPLIRYKTGDLVVKLPQTRCECGNNSIRIGPVVSRKNHTIKLKGTTIYPSQIQQVLHRFIHDQIINYQIVVSSSKDGLDLIELKIGTNLNSRNISTILRNSFRSHIRVIPEMHFTTPEEVEKHLFAGSSRKATIFKDCRIMAG